MIRRAFFIRTFDSHHSFLQSKPACSHFRHIPNFDLLPVFDRPDNFAWILLCSDSQKPWDQEPAHLNALRRRHPVSFTDQRVCTKCNTIASSQVVHCSRCDVCFDGFDHHCVWASKCIANNNLFEFYGFIGGVALMLIYFFTMNILSLV